MWHKKSVLLYNLLAISDKKSTVPLDFSLYAEAGRKKDFGLARKQLKERFRKQRVAETDLIKEQKKDELFEKDIAGSETRMDLECIFRYNQDFKDCA